MQWPMVITIKNAVDLWQEALVGLSRDDIDHLPLTQWSREFLSQYGIPSVNDRYLVEFFHPPFIIDDRRSNNHRIVVFTEDDDDYLIGCYEYSDTIHAFYFDTVRYVAENLPGLLIILARLRYVSSVFLNGNRMNRPDVEPDVFDDFPFDSGVTMPIMTPYFPPPPLIEKFKDRFNTMMQDLGPVSDDPPLWLRCQSNDDACFDDMAIYKRTLWVLRDIARIDARVFDPATNLLENWWPKMVERAMKGPGPTR